MARTYYPHIDGLRGISILLVLLFHLDVPYFDGGFVGVDVFFVISGFLITSLIVDRKQAGSFSLKSFYIRRIRRLMPALFATILLTLLAGFVILPLFRIERLVVESAASAISLSNILFWSESGYFDVDSTVKPLLHTWSLAVEEQFYLLWPALILLIGRVGFKWFLFGSLVMMLVISLISSEMLLAVAPDTAFFWTPFRIFEFAIGGMLFVFRQSEPPKVVTELLGFVSLWILGFVCVTFNHTTFFPGFSALLPCLAAAAIIFGNTPSMVRRFLSGKLLVKLGLVSYSVYLVHWPLVVYTKYILAREFTWIDQISLGLISVLLGVILYYFVERPFRSDPNSKYNISSKRLYVVLLIVASCLFALGLYVFTGQSLIQYKESSIALTRKEINEGKQKRFELRKLICQKKNNENCNRPVEDIFKNVLILGDSHAPDAYNALKTAYPDLNFVLRSLGGCPPMIETDLNIMSKNHVNRQKCVDLNAKSLDPSYLRKFRTIVINVLFNWYKPEHLMNTVHWIQSNSQADIVVFGNYLHFNVEVPELLAKNVDFLLDSSQLKHFALYERELVGLSVGQFSYISKKDIFCNGPNLADCQVMFGKVPVAYDENHLSYEAAVEMGRRIKERGLINLGRGLEIMKGTQRISSMPSPELLENTSFVENSKYWSGTGLYNSTSSSVKISRSNHLAQVVPIDSQSEYAISYDIVGPDSGLFRLQLNWLDSTRQFINSDITVESYTGKDTTFSAVVISPTKAAYGVFYIGSHDDSWLEVTQVSMIKR